MRELIAVFRRSGGLSRVWLERGEGGARLVETEGSGDAELDDAFGSLGRFDRDRREDREALELVWCATVPAPDGWRTLPLPSELSARSAPRATAAHPRGYRGTIVRPPQAPRSRVDLRLYLDRFAAMRALGLDLRGDPYVSAHHASDEGSIDELSPRARAYVLPLLRGMRWRSALELAHRFDATLRELPGAEAALVAIAHAAPDACATWWDGVVARPPHLRRAWLDIVSQLDVGRLDASAVEVGIARVEALGEDAFEDRARTYGAMLSRGASPAYAASGLELTAEPPWKLEWALANAPPGCVDAADPVRGLVAAMGPFTEDWQPARYAMRCWWILGSLAGAERVLDTVREASLAAEARRQWIDMIMSFRWRADASEDWRSCAGAIERAIRGGRVRAPSHLDATFFHGRLDAARFERAVTLSAHAGDRSVAVMIALMVLDEHIDATALSSAALDAIERATRRTADEYRVLRALGALASELPDVVTRRLEAEPAALLRAARALGVMHPERIRAVVRRAAQHECFDPPASDRAWREASRVRFTRDPFSRAVREHFAGARALTTAQLERHLQRARERWDAVRVALIEEHAREELRRAVGDADAGEGWHHALALLAGAEQHRRGLARALRAWSRGDREAIERHPASRSWLSRHPSINAASWREGIELTRDVVGVGPLRLAVEHDLLEVLRLGTYVESCLGLGGGLASGAAGIALDVNKRVIYARDADGRVRARQLLAISESDELVCFAVYPLDAPDALVDVFREYDLALAAHLALPLCTGEYRVENVLSLALWDDGAWDPR